MASTIRDELNAEIVALRERAAELHERASRRAPDPMLEHALAELSTGLEELRVAQEELREQNARLVEVNAELALERRRYVALFDRAPIGYFVTDGAGVVQRVNEAAARLFGEPASGLIGRPLRSRFDPADRARWSALLHRVATAEGAAVADVLSLVSSASVARPCRFEGVLQDGRGGPCLWIVDDPSGRELASQVRDLDGEVRRKDEFLAMLGHELRNPIAPIRAAVELWRAQDGQLTTEQRARTVEVVGRQAEHLTRLVDELLDVSRVTHGKIDLRRERVDLRDTIEQSREAVREQSRAHVLELEVQDSAVVVDGDPVRLRQVFVNLLDNAIKFTKKGGRIVVRLETAAGIAIVHVRDEGVGMAPEQIEGMFTPFAQGSARPHTTAKGGLGLGLALVRRLVELHGGSVVAKSDGVGHGSELVVCLPIVAEGQHARTPEATPETTTTEALGLLVVEDNEDGAEMLEELLRSMGHRPCVALDGAAALEAVASARFDAVLLDLGLPDMDGLEVARRIRAMSPEVTLIAITGHGDQSTRDRVRADGFAAHLLKPVDAATLRRALSELVLSPGPRPENRGDAIS